MQPVEHAMRVEGADREAPVAGDSLFGCGVEPEAHRAPGRFGHGGLAVPGIHYPRRASPAGIDVRKSGSTRGAAPVDRVRVEAQAAAATRLPRSAMLREAAAMAGQHRMPRVARYRRARAPVDRGARQPALQDSRLVEAPKQHAAVRGDRAAAVRRGRAPRGGRPESHQRRQRDRANKGGSSHGGLTGAGRCHRGPARRSLHVHAIAFASFAAGLARRSPSRTRSASRARIGTVSSRGISPSAIRCS